MLQRNSQSALLSRIFIGLPLLIGLVLGYSRVHSVYSVPRRGESSVEVRFSPKGGGLALIIKAIEEGEQTIYMQAYTFTLAPVAEALIAAKRRGVRIYLIVDEKRYRAGEAPQVDQLEGVIDYIGFDKARGYAHDKVLIIDGHLVITGSFNFTERAEEVNRENILAIRYLPSLAAKYQAHWQASYDQIKAAAQSKRKKRLARKSRQQKLLDGEDKLAR